MPKAGQPVSLSLKWPKAASVKEFKVRVQTDLFAKWETIPTNVMGAAPDRVSLKTFDQPMPASYRVDVTLDDGQTAEIWGYFQVKK
ncbi:hypothetical protein [Limnoglobus roseus]|uniref:Uncharacterized protein n=1 Tax=Limnoglobus roseus TaxID=2598579 RepID=A0A5C1ATE8_9BACT|nr:hypothetical protein [Limnoglobus roseus]QEL20882.1 hypothetical protein PX52LOC_08003 [Limnoglobus roseus]